jgi:hypothetical protein
VLDEPAASLFAIRVDQHDEDVFLSCEDADIQAANAADASNATDSTVYCQTEASPIFTCRSTGGGVQNRRVCLPGGTSQDAAAD